MAPETHLDKTYMWTLWWLGHTERQRLQFSGCQRLNAHDQVRSHPYWIPQLASLADFNLDKVAHGSSFNENSMSIEKKYWIRPGLRSSGVTEYLLKLHSKELLT